MADADPPIVTAALIVIGNEVLSGRVQDANLAFLARRLNERGVRLAEARVIRDDEAAIIATVNELRARHAYVFTTGGIGPTHDDITADSIAKAFGVGLTIHPKARAMLEALYGDRLNEARLRMARVPEGAELVENPISQAPGFRFGNVYVLAGVPKIMQGMYEGLQHELAGGTPVQSRTVSAHIGEGGIADGLAAIQGRFAEIEIGSYPFFRNQKIGTAIVLRGIDPARLDAAAAEVAGLMRSHQAEPVLGEIT